VELREMYYKDMVQNTLFVIVLMKLWVTDEQEIS
jgi:hypothetical protein